MGVSKSGQQNMDFQSVPSNELGTNVRKTNTDLGVSRYNWNV